MQGYTGREAPFSNRTLFWLIFLGLFATLGVAVTSVFEGDGNYETSSGANSFSKSALGHAAIVELLRREGWIVMQSQHGTTEKIRSGDPVLVILEPGSGSAATSRIDDLVGFGPALLVLPKRGSGPHPLQAGWIGRQFLRNVEAPQAALKAVLDEAEVFRPESRPVTWQSDFLDGQAPDISDLQLMKSEAIDPIIWNEQGILFGRATTLYDTPIWILADPDLLATHGLARGWNAEFAAHVFRTAAAGSDTLVIDEVIHGFTMDPSLARAMLRPPFLYATLAGLLAVITFILALTRRFGAPLRQLMEPRDSKAVFIDNAARILQMADKEHEALMRLFEDTALLVAEALNVPAGLERRRLEAWLDEKARLKGIQTDYSTLKRRLQQIREDDDTRRRRLLILAEQFYTWKREMLNDPK